MRCNGFSGDVILHDFYADDLLSGTDSIDEVIRLKHEVNIILQAYGMELRKWVSNDSWVIQDSDNTQARDIRDTSVDAQRNFNARSSSNELYVLLTTSRIHIYDKVGNMHECRDLLDQGSHPHVMTNRLCDKLELQRARMGTILSGIEQSSQNVLKQWSS